MKKGAAPGSRPLFKLNDQHAELLCFEHPEPGSAP